MCTAALQNFMGANIDLLCVPNQVRLNESFAIQIQYETDIPRDIDIHFDVIDEPTKTWVTGMMVESNYQTANVSLNVTVPQNIIKENIIWKVYLSPRGESFPNMLAEKGLAIDFGNEIVHPCSEMLLTGHNITNKPIRDFVLLETKNLTNVIYIRSQLFSQRDAYITFNIMDSQTNMLIYSAPENIHVKLGNTNELYNMTVNIPKLNQTKIYSIVMLSPDGSWENRLAEDRHYF
jgi:hypothetical protein